MTSKIFYRRRLPHIQPPEAAYTITYRLAGSLPRVVLTMLKEANEQQEVELLNKYQGNKEMAKAELDALQDAYWKKIDSYLDQVLYGPTWLEDPAIAGIVKKSLHDIDNKFNHWTIWSYSIMANHVHLECTLQPGAPPLCKILQNHKSYTAVLGNRHLGRSGQFWQRESFDRLIRNDDDFYRRIYYTINNSVEANLVDNWQEWPHTYVHSEVKRMIV